MAARRSGVVGRLILDSEGSQPTGQFRRKLARGGGPQASCAGLGSKLRGTHRTTVRLVESNRLVKERW